MAHIRNMRHMRNRLAKHLEVKRFFATESFPHSSTITLRQALKQLARLLPSNGIVPAVIKMAPLT